MEIILVKNHIKKSEVEDLAKKGFGDMVKAVVDLEKGIMAIGGEMLNKEALIKHIEQEDEIGNTIMRVELEYLKDLASSAIYQK